MNLFDILLNGLDYLPKINIIEMIVKIRYDVFMIQKENCELREQLAILRRENERMTQTIVSYIERDISYMTNQVNKLNSSSTRIVEELD
jgi:cob(I)alamin adenosyltransferase